MKFLARNKTLLVSFLISVVVCSILMNYQGVIIDFKDGGQNTPYEIAKLISSISGTILGFLLTAVAMLAAVMDRKLVENMRKTGHYRVFIVDCFINCLLLLCAMIFGIVTLFTVNPYLSYVFYIMIFFSVTATFFLITQGHRFLLIFTRI